MKDKFLKNRHTPTIQRHFSLPHSILHRKLKLKVGNQFSYREKIHSYQHLHKEMQSGMLLAA